MIGAQPDKKRKSPLFGRKKRQFYELKSNEKL
jgi:hypothetical protein